MKTHIDNVSILLDSILYSCFKMITNCIRQYFNSRTTVTSSYSGNTSAIVSLGGNYAGHRCAMRTTVRPAIIVVVLEIPSDKIIYETILIIIQSVAALWIVCFSPIGISEIRPCIFN